MIQSQPNDVAPQAESASPLSSLGRAIQPVPDPVGFDDIDLHILRLLADDSRLSQRAVAKAVNMSAPAVGERIARLERSGVLQGYSIEVDWARLGYAMVVYLPVVAVTGGDIGGLMQALESMPEVENIDVVSGSYDLLVRLRARDHRHLTEILLNRIWQMKHLQRTETLICLSAARPTGITQKLLDDLLERQEGATTHER